MLREILGEELERIGDPRLEWVSVTGVSVNPELSSATVFFSALEGADSDPLVLEALADRRVRLQGAIGRQARLRRTPELHFQPDPGIRAGWRVEEILRDIGPIGDSDDVGDPEQTERDAETDTTGPAPAAAAAPEEPATALPENERGVERGPGGSGSQDGGHDGQATRAAD